MAGWQYQVSSRWYSVSSARLLPPLRLPGLASEGLTRQRRNPRKRPPSTRRLRRIIRPADFHHTTRRWSASFEILNLIATWAISLSPTTTVREPAKPSLAISIRIQNRQTTSSLGIEKVSRASYDQGQGTFK